MAVRCAIQGDLSTPVSRETLLASHVEEPIVPIQCKSVSEPCISLGIIRPVTANRQRHEAENASTFCFPCVQIVNCVSDSTGVG